MKSYLAYLRKSRSDDPNEPVDVTLSRHKQLLCGLAKKLRIPIDEFYEEVVTGDSLFCRPEMLRLLSNVESGNCEAVLCVDLDRLGRGGQKDAGTILETFKFSGTKIITLEKTYDLENDFDEEMAEFKTFFSRREYKMINKRLQRGLKQTIQDGGYIANAPYGYRKTTINKRPSLEIVETEAYFVRMIFDLYVNQGLGCQIIASTINDLGARPHRADKFQRTSVRHIIKNPVFCGKIVWDRSKWIRKGQRGNEKTMRVCQPKDKWIITDGIHSPIISEELFNDAQEVLAGRYHPPVFDGVVKNPFAGLIVCARCGNNIQLLRSEPRYSYYRCPYKGCCPGSDTSDVESVILDKLRDELLELEIKIQEKAQVDVTFLKTALESTRAEIKKFELQKEKQYDLLEQGIYTLDIFRERSSTLSDKINALQGSAASYASEIERHLANSPQKQAQRLQHVLDIYYTATPAEINQLLKGIIDKIVYEKLPGAKKKEYSVTVFLKQIFL